MIFSDVLKYSSTFPVFSLNGIFLAINNNYKCIIKEVKSMNSIKIFTCVDSISELQWSNDSLFILCVLKKRNIIQIWSIQMPEWQCKINEGAAGLTKCEWCPDSRHILTTSDFFIRITLWSLENKNVSYMKHPKNCIKYYDFSRDEKYFALAERRNAKDFISIFKLNEWILLKNFSILTTDLDGLTFINYGNIVCWDSQFRYNIYVYNLNGELIKSLSNNPIEFHLGIKCLKYNQNNQLIIVGNYTAECDILNAINLEIITKINCSIENLKKSKSRSQIFYENDKGEYIVKSNLKDINMDLNKIVPKDKIQGVIQDIQFSTNGLYFFTIYDNESNILFIWSVNNLSLHTVLIHKKNIKLVKWSPNSTELIIATDGDRIYFWTPLRCISVKIPIIEITNFNDIKWNSCGKILCLVSKLSCCIAYLEESDMK